MSEVSRPPVARVELSIRRPVAEVFSAFVDPERITRFWLASTSGPLAAGATVHWSFMVEGAEADTTVTELVEHERISWTWSDGTTVVLSFTSPAYGMATVALDCSGFAGDDDDAVAAAIEATQGFTIVLCDLKVWLETGRSPNLVRDKAALLEGETPPPPTPTSNTPDLKVELLRKLQSARSGVLSKLEDLDEYDRRRPMTPTGTNLLGLVKHLAGVEYGYLGESFGRPAPETLPWIEDGSIWQGADMWATPDESSEDLVALYRRAAAHGDATVEQLELDAPGSVDHWPEDRRATTLGVLLIRMVAETAQHAGHADIIRELIDGRGGPDHDQVDQTTWEAYLARIRAAADAFKP